MHRSDADGRTPPNPTPSCSAEPLLDEPAFLLQASDVGDDVGSDAFDRGHRSESPGARRPLGRPLLGTTRRRDATGRSTRGPVGAPDWSRAPVGHGIPHKFASNSCSPRATDPAAVVALVFVRLLRTASRNHHGGPPPSSFVRACPSSRGRTPNARHHRSGEVPPSARTTAIMPRSSWSRMWQ